MTSDPDKGATSLELTAEQKQEREVLDRILARGDLTVIGLPVADIGDIYKIVQEWRVMGGQQRWINDIRQREALRAEVARLRDALQDVQGIALNGTEVGDLPEDKLFAIDQRVTEELTVDAN